MVTKEDMQRYFWYFFGVMGVVFFWTGVWDGVGTLPYLESPLLSLIVGILMLMVAGFVKGSEALNKAEQTAHKVLQEIHIHPKKHEFHIKYQDKMKNKELVFRADKLHRIEKGFLVMLKEGKEIFLPIHRVTEVLHKGKSYKKLR